MNNGTTIYEIIKVLEGTEKKYLDDGWEPYATVAEVSTHHYNVDRMDVSSRTYICLRKAVKYIFWRAVPSKENVPAHWEKVIMPAQVEIDSATGDLVYRTK
jgi:hypothetical protein